MTLRALIICLALVAIAANGARAQQQATPSLAEVARQAEASKATAKKAKKAYTNADLSADPRSAPAPAASTTAGVASGSLGEPVSAEKVAARSEETVEREAVTQQSEEQWRGRAQSLRIQIEKLQTRMAALLKPNPARDANAAALGRHNGEVAGVQTSLDALRKQWTSLEEAARLAKIPPAWLAPQPGFQ